MDTKDSPVVNTDVEDESLAQPIIVGRKLAEDPRLPQGKEDGTELEAPVSKPEVDEEPNVASGIPALQPSEELKAALENEQPAKPVPATAPPAAVSEIALPGSETTIKSDSTNKDGTAKEQPVHDEKVTKLIEDKTYFLPIQQQGHRRSMKLLAILIAGILVVGLVGFYLAADAGVVHAGFTPPTNLIPDK